MYEMDAPLQLYFEDFVSLMSFFFPSELSNGFPSVIALGLWKKKKQLFLLKIHLDQFFYVTLNFQMREKNQKTAERGKKTITSRVHGHV